MMFWFLYIPKFVEQVLLYDVYHVTNIDIYSMNTGWWTQVGIDLVICCIQSE